MALSFFLFCFSVWNGSVFVWLSAILRRRGYNTRHLIIVGTREKAKRFHQLLSEHEEWGLQVIGFVQASEGELQKEIEGHRVLGHASDLLEICKSNQVDEVVFCLPKDLFIDAESYVRDLEEMGITVRMVLDFSMSILHAGNSICFTMRSRYLPFIPNRSMPSSFFSSACSILLAPLSGLRLTAVLFPVHRHRD